MSRSVKAALAAAMLLPAPALAQQLSVDAAVEVASDLRERGISVSGGRAAASATVGVQSGGLRADVRARTLRESARHGGADIGIDATLSYRIDSGGLSVDLGGTMRTFPDVRGDWDYGELFASANYLLGPAELSATAFYAPDQASIGGDNLYLRARGRVGIPATPFTAVAHIGRSSGSTDDPLRAARLRPGGNYTDWAVGAEWNRGPLNAGLRYGDTSIERRDVASPLGDPGHNGARVVATFGVSF